MAALEVRTTMGNITLGGLYAVFFCEMFAYQEYHDVNRGITAAFRPTIVNDITTNATCGYIS